MVVNTLQNFHERLNSLRSRPRQTAQMISEVNDFTLEGFSGAITVHSFNCLDNLALTYRVMLNIERNRPAPPSGIEKELKSLKNKVNRLAKHTKELQKKPEYMTFVQDVADRECADTEESSIPYRWFPLNHNDGTRVWREADDDSMVLELWHLEAFLSRVVQAAGEKKAKTNVGRTAGLSAKEFLVLNLCLLAAKIERSKDHVPIIAGVIHEWSTDENLDTNFGTNALETYRHRKPRKGSVPPDDME